MYIIEGNIGAGKSTFLKIIEQYIPEVAVLFEPVNRWDQHEAGMSLLRGFYTNPTRWAYTLETYAMVCRIRDHLKDLDDVKKISVMERSIFSGYYCFAKNSYMSGFMSEIEWSVYQQWFSFLITHKIPMPKGFIYLRTAPEVAHERIIKRSRSSEDTISLDYLKDLHERHEEFLMKRDVTPELAQVPVLVLDAHVNFESDSTIQQELIERVREFIRLT